MVGIRLRFLSPRRDILLYYSTGVCTLYRADVGEPLSRAALVQRVLQAYNVIVVVYVLQRVPCRVLVRAVDLRYRCGRANVRDVVVLVRSVG